MTTYTGTQSRRLARRRAEAEGEPMRTPLRDTRPAWEGPMATEGSRAARAGLLLLFALFVAAVAVFAYFALPSLP
jgi:hypothetical protein